jgi:hypothetical protein
MALLASFFSPLRAAPTINVPAGIETKPWDALLKKYVSDRGMVAYAPERLRAFLEKPGVRIEYLEYGWGLNDQSGRGANFRAGLFDRFFGNPK